jgi:hypothetical protein
MNPIPLSLNDLHDATLLEIVVDSVSVKVVAA